MVLEPESLSEATLAVGEPPLRQRENVGESSSAKGQQGTRRFAYNHWPDSDDRELCRNAVTSAPERTPISGRTGVTVSKWLVVARRDERVLICNRLHDGDCEWPWDVQTG